MRRESYNPMLAAELASALDDEDIAAFQAALHDLEVRGQIVLTRKHRYGMPERMNLVVGRLQGHSKGFGFVISDRQGERDVFVGAEDLNGAMHNDRVIARLNRGMEEGRRPEGEVIRVLERANTTLVGTYEKSGRLGFVTPDESRISGDVLVLPEDAGKASSGDKVVVEVSRWPEKRRNAEGRVIEVLGKKGAPGVDVVSVVRKYRLPESFPDGVVKAANRVPVKVAPEELAGRRDLRDWPTVTIDGADAKDLDDAVTLDRLPNGHYRLGVHIADVGYYVREGSALDREAFSRGTSVYLVDRVIPMLPHRLSNGICSLNAGEDRMAMSCLMEVDALGRVVEYDILPSVIRVDERMTYRDVQAILEGSDPGLAERYSPFVDRFHLMRDLCLILRQRRMDRGAIDFASSEAKVVLDENGHPQSITRRTHGIAERIIEEFMILANETVAGHFFRLEIPFIYRTHAEPSPDRMTELNDFLHTLGYHVKTGDGAVQPRAFQEVLQKVAGQPEEMVVATVMLRSMKHARYDSGSLGHFGLAAKEYSHFTSPIRRYPDLCIHRVIREVLEKGRLSAKRLEKLAESMATAAEQSSIRERVAEEAERESVDMKIVEYMQRHLGDEFEGVISGVMPFGLFVALENTAEGLVHVSSIADDYYQYQEKSMTLVGEHTRRSFRIGQRLMIRLARADVDTRQLDFEIVTDGENVAGKRREAAAEQGRKVPSARTGGKETPFKPVRAVTKVKATHGPKAAKGYGATESRHGHGKGRGRKKGPVI